MDLAPKQVIVMRKDLNMRKGKMVAQGAHASMKVFFDMFVWEGQENYGKATIFVETDSPMARWMNGLFTKIVVGGENLADVVNAYEEAKRQNIPCALIIDAGLTEFNGTPTITCCAIGPDNQEKIDKITGHLKLL